MHQYTTELLVLSTALTPSVDNEKLAETLNVELDEYGFFKIPNPLHNPVGTTRKGVYVCGFAHSPKDIPDTITEASGAASQIGMHTPKSIGGGK